jgi:hypothetical protein
MLFLLEDPTFFKIDFEAVDFFTTGIAFFF